MFSRTLDTIRMITSQQGTPYKAARRLHTSETGLLGLLENLELLEFSWNFIYPPMKTLETWNFSGILLEFFSSTLESQKLENLCLRHSF